MSAKSRKKHQVDLSDDVANIKMALSATGHHLIDKAANIKDRTIENAREYSINAKDSVTDYTERKPLKALGIAAAIGVVAGLLITRR